MSRVKDTLGFFLSLSMMMRERATLPKCLEAIILEYMVRIDC